MLLKLALGVGVGAKRRSTHFDRVNCWQIHLFCFCDWTALNSNSDCFFYDLASDSTGIFRLKILPWTEIYSQNDHIRPCRVEIRRVWGGERRFEGILDRERTYLASVDHHVHFRRSRFRRKLNRVLAHELDRQIVRVGLGVIPRHAIDARVREVLVHVLAEQSQEVHLHRSHCFVSDLKITILEWCWKNGQGLEGASRKRSPLNTFNVLLKHPWNKIFLNVVELYVIICYIMLQIKITCGFVW